MIRITKFDENCEYITIEEFEKALRKAKEDGRRIENSTGTFEGMTTARISFLLEDSLFAIEIKY